MNKIFHENRVPVKIKKTHPNAKTPTKGTEGAMCYDLYAVDVENAQPHPADPNAVIYRTGIEVEIYPGWGIEIHSRSGHGFKHGVRLSNCTGLIDEDYRGEIMVSLRIDGDGKSMDVDEGDRIAQLRIVPVHGIEFIEVDELSDTKRGTGGFGSTGTK